MCHTHTRHAKNGPQYEAHARRSRIIVLFSYVPEADGPDARGGTLIAIPYDSIELSQGETRDDAIDRIKTSVRESARTGRVISAEISIEGHHIRAVSCYAYCTPSRLRPPFFEKVLSRFVNKHTVLGRPCVTLGGRPSRRAAPAAPRRERARRF